MKEFKYKIKQYEMKKLIEIEYKYDKELKKNFCNRAKLGAIIIFILTFIIYIVAIYACNNSIIYACKKSIIYALVWTLIWALFSLVIKLVKRKISILKILNRMTSCNDKDIFVKFDNENIEIKTDSFTHNYVLKKCTILFIDDERIYIKLSDNTMIYIPRDAFKDSTEFITLFKDNSIKDCIQSNENKKI